MDNLPPFFVGQRVVALKDHSQGAFKKGQVFIVQGIKLGCCFWLVDVGINHVYGYMKCAICKKTSKIEHNKWLFTQRMFAPIETFKQVTFTSIMEAEPISEN